MPLMCENLITLLPISTDLPYNMEKDMSEEQRTQYDMKEKIVTTLPWCGTNRITSTTAPFCVPSTISTSLGTPSDKHPFSAFTLREEKTLIPFLVSLPQVLMFPNPLSLDLPLLLYLLLQNRRKHKMKPMTELWDKEWVLQKLYPRGSCAGNTWWCLGRCVIQCSKMKEM